ncbi:nitrate ABC transporter substrate-binding protein [Mesorhizobium sp. AR10]|uniref:nitrate ABC transporter substrate-binding protein n=1 Tax=Mesorhizobium sp. AR10 TaxID=2865839 RepID=UPI00215DE58C|nr:nitrate ABC transporter substrate-binding protein [Mesorhizobium sp. AR10]UVK36956.1 nitrate ABC transporter substrate-binding protein [Mesorhizobium sp. AR10]
MAISIKIAARDWDFLTPLLLGDVSSERLEVKVDRVATLLGDLSGDPVYDAAEMSFSRYASRRAAGDDTLVGVPNFIMRGFRHRCIITRAASPLEQLSQLAGKRIGLTGWRDSGNTWTRAALRHEGVGVEDAYWFAGRLTSDHPIVDRLDGFGRPGRIEAIPGERPMMELLETGELDAVFTPFMPQGYFQAGSQFRQLVRDFRTAELEYFRDVGYVPGMHLIALKADVVERHPWLPDELSALIDASHRLWTEKRRKYAETSPWIIDELLQSARALPQGWSDSGLAENRTMIEDFARELHLQGIADRLLSPEELFPFETKSRRTAA